MKAFILGLDVSTTCVGWALLSLNYATDRELYFGKFIPPKSTKKERVSWFARAQFIYTQLDQLLEDKPVVAVAVEQLNSFRSGETTRQLAGINMGAQYLVYRRFNLEPSEINTATMKKIFTGSGAAKKWDMIAAANRIYGLSLRWPERPTDQANKEMNDEDIADGIAAAHCMFLEVGEELLASLKESNNVE